MSNLLREDFDPGSASVDEIEPGLLLGNLTAALDIPTLEKYEITHILTVDICPLPQTITHSSKFFIKWLKISDLPYEDLLSYLDDTFTFIIQGMRKGCVLVHCYYGVSRSVAIVIAFLMKKYSLKYNDAISRLRERRRIIGPNYGFQRQLQLYEVLKYVVNKTNLQYRLFRLRVTANLVSKGFSFLNMCYGMSRSQPNLLYSSVKIVPRSCQDIIKPDPSLLTVKPNPKTYRCKKCRRIVASEDNLLPHVKKEKLSWKDEKWSSDYSASDLCQQIYFIEPLIWIESVMTSENGKINCPKCKAKLGSFNWVMGSQCLCGARVSPSFYLIPSKVDYSDFMQNVQISV